MKYQDAIKQPGVVLIEFFASWCPHCQHMMPIVAQVKEMVEGSAQVFQYDIDKDPDDTSAAGVESIPTFILYKDGKEVWRHTGEVQGEVLVNEIQKALV